MSSRADGERAGPTGPAADELEMDKLQEPENGKGSDYLWKWHLLLCYMPLEYGLPAKQSQRMLTQRIGSAAAALGEGLCCTLH